MNVPGMRPPLDFDRWVALARRNPEAFERIRERLIEKAINQAPARNRQRLRGLQWKLDQIRRTSRTPMVACLRMNRLLWDAVIGEQGLLEGLGRLQSPPAEHRRPRRAKILPFRGRSIRGGQRQ